MSASPLPRVVTRPALAIAGLALRAFALSAATAARPEWIAAALDTAKWTGADRNSGSYRCRQRLLDRILPPAGVPGGYDPSTPGRGDGARGSLLALRVTIHGSAGVTGARWFIDDVPTTADVTGVPGPPPRIEALEAARCPKSIR